MLVSRDRPGTIDERKLGKRQIPCSQELSYIRQSEILTNFLGIAGLVPLRTQDISLGISSDCKYCLGLKVEATVERGHRVNVFDTYRKYSSSDTLSQLAMKIHRNYQRNLTRVFSVCSEMPSDSQ